MTNTNKIKPFGIWHVADVEEECDFYLFEQFGDVACEKCVKLYDEAALEAARQEGRDESDYLNKDFIVQYQLEVKDLKARLAAIEAVSVEGSDKIWVRNWPATYLYAVRDSHLRAIEDANERDPAYIQFIPAIQLQAALARVAQREGLLSEQKETIAALNTCVGGEESTTTENLTQNARLEEERDTLRAKLKLATDAATTEARASYDGAYSDGKVDQAAENCCKYAPFHAELKMRKALAAIKEGEV